MTRNEILAMEAGPELNSLLAPLVGYSVESCTEAVSGCVRPCCCRWKGANGVQIIPLPLSETWEGMRLIDDAMFTKGWMLELSRGGSGYFMASYWRFLNGVLWSNDSENAQGFAPHAVALAAMLAVGGGDAR